MQVHDLTALEQAAAIRRGDLTAVEVTRHYLERAHALNERVGAFVTITDDLALEQAAEADRLVREAEDPASLPVLHGVVVPVKDLNRVRGVPIRFGSLAVDVIADVDDDIVVELRRGHTVMTGKTTTPEFGLPAYTESDIGPYARTPWDLARGAGGSSGGAAAAVAAGLAPVAQGSDGGGSIRIPASVCGLVGLKPSRGLISNGPMPDGPGRLGVQGTLARTVEDTAALLGVLAGVDDAYLRGLRIPDRSLLIGRYREPVIADTTAHHEAVAAFEAASALLEDLGHRMVDIDKPLPLEAVPHFELVWAAGAAGIPLTAEQEAQLRPLTRWLRERGRALAPEQVEDALALMAWHAERALAETAHLDAILTPTLAELPALVGAIRDDDDPAADFEAQKRFTPYTSPYNMTGQPAVSLPMHWTGDGLPVGIQLVAQPMHESVLLGLAAQLEQARPWSHRHPEVW